MQVGIRFIKKQLLVMVLEIRLVVVLLIMELKAVMSFGLPLLLERIIISVQHMLEWLEQLL